MFAKVLSLAMLTLRLGAQTRSQNPFHSEKDVAEGRRLYTLNCRTCHGDQGERGDRSARLASTFRRHGSSDAEMFHTVSSGVPGTGMPGSFLDEDSIWRILAFVRTLEAARPEDESAGQAPRELPPSAPVSVDQLLHPEQAPGNWLMYSGNYAGHRFSPLGEVTAANAGKLQLKWAFQRGVKEKVETTPLVVDGVMYVTMPPNDAYALDTGTGDVLWEYKRNLPTRIPVCCGQVNRGFAVAGDRLFMGTLDAHLIALDRRTGRVIWDVKVAEVSESYSITHAPLVVKDKVLVGVAGGEYGIRGHVDAYRASDGGRVWRTYTIPGAGEPGNESWAGDSWKHGGAGIWITGSYDPDLNLSYWGTSNPGPDWNGDGRKGDNLYSCSVLALNADTGELTWHFQFTPHDTHDWDAVQIMVLADREYGGRPRKLLVTANRNGFYYVLDRATGEYLHSRAYVKQTWAKEIDRKGRPVILPAKDPTPEGNRVWPSTTGGTNWWSPSYSESAGLLFVPTLERSSIYYKGEAEYHPGRLFEGGTGRGHPEGVYGSIRAFEALTGQPRWEHRFDSPTRAGVMATAGGIVFGASGDGRVVALNATSGRELWKLNLGGAIHAGPMSYLSKRRQRIAIAAGSGVFVFGLPD